MNQLESIVNEIVADNELHAKWLNTLSLMENCGAKKIAAFEDPQRTTLTILKHAAEEFRHAYYLKKQITKLDVTGFVDYAPQYLLAPISSANYLRKLDVEVCRFLKNEYRFQGSKMFYGAYLLVTYAIEVRADSLYGIYQRALDSVGSRVNVKSIIAEEEGHLQEMHDMLIPYDPQWKAMCEAACEFESKLFGEWIGLLAEEVPVRH